MVIRLDRMQAPKASAMHPLFRAGQISESLQAELDIILATTNAEEELAHRNAEVKYAATSAAFKQMQFYRRQRKEILQKLIEEKKEYIEKAKAFLNHFTEVVENARKLKPYEDPPFSFKDEENEATKILNEAEMLVNDGNNQKGGGWCSIA